MVCRLYLTKAGMKNNSKDAYGPKKAGRETTTPRPQEYIETQGDWVGKSTHNEQYLTL